MELAEVLCSLVESTHKKKKLSQNKIFYVCLVSVWKMF